MQLLASFLKQPPREPVPPTAMQLKGPRVTLRMAMLGDWKEWRNLREQSQDFLGPWEPSWPPHTLTKPFFDGMLRRQMREWRQGKGFTFLIFLHTGRKPVLIGGIGLNEVRRGIAQKGTLGYWIGEPFAHKGYMTEAAGLIGDFTFRTLKLNRIEASCLPHNEPSRRLLQRLGFAEEGYAKSYLLIDGAWQDHVLWGKTRA